MQLKNAIALLKKHGTNYREYKKGRCQHYVADVNGWEIEVYESLSGEASYPIIRAPGFSAEGWFHCKGGLRGAIARCKAERPEDAQVFWDKDDPRWTTTVSLTTAAPKSTMRPSDRRTRP